MSPDKAQPESEGILQKLSGVSKKVALPALGAAALSIQEVRDAVFPLAEAATISSPSDYDADFGTSYIPSGGVSCFNGVVPHDFTGSYGFRSDACSGTLEETTDGTTFTDVRATIASEITSAGGSIEGTYLTACDYSDAFDELLVVDPIMATQFVLEGYSSGITGVKILQGTSLACGSIDEATGTYHLPADTRGVEEIHEFTETASPSPVYAYGSTDIYSTTLSTALDMAVFTKTSGRATYIAENISDASPTVTAFGMTGFTAGLFEAHETGGTVIALLSNDSTLQYVEITPDAVTPVDADSDGYTEDEDCDDAVAAVNPGAEEVCDGVDNNCDSVVDTDATDKATWYQDYDGDGLGNPAVSEEACDQPEGYVANNSDTDDSGEVSCIDDSVAGPYDEGDVICLGTGGTSVVGSGDVIYDGYSSVRLDELLDAADLEGLGVLDASDFGWRFEAVDSDSVGGLVMGVSGFTEGEEVGSFTVYAGQFNAINTVTEESTPIGPGTYTVEYNEEPTDRDGDGVEDSLDLFPDDKSEWADADGDGLGDNGDEDDDNDGFTDEVEMAAGTNPLDANSYPIEDTGDDTGSGTVDSGEDTDEPVEEKPTKKKPEQTGCSTASTPVGQPSRAPWHAAVVSAFAAGIAMLRRRKAA